MRSHSQVQGLGLGRIFWGPQFNPLSFPRAPWELVNLLLPFEHSRASGTGSAALSHLVRHLPQLFPTTARCHDEDELLSKAHSLARHIPGCLDKSRFAARCLTTCLEFLADPPAACFSVLPQLLTFNPTSPLGEEGSKKGNELKFRKLKSELQA